MRRFEEEAGRPVQLLSCLRVHGDRRGEGKAGIAVCCREIGDSGLEER